MRYTTEQLDAMPVGTRLSWAHRGIAGNFCATKVAKAGPTPWSCSSAGTYDGFRSSSYVGVMNFTHRADPQPIQEARDEPK